MIRSEIRITYPMWVLAAVDFERIYDSDTSRMELVLALSEENVSRGWGGPFAAAVFERESGRLVSVGVNSVVRMSSSLLHAEVLALAMAQAKTRSYTLAAPGLARHELVTSCDPCAMCLGAVLWSGVTRLVCGADREDALSIGFEEGPVSDASFTYLSERGIELERGLMRDRARAVLHGYRAGGGTLYNA
jgi:tRNA(Arg) A34 adenosine deaminase TadA